MDRVVEHPGRVVGHLPGMAVEVDGGLRVAAPRSVTATTSGCRSSTSRWPNWSSESRQGARRPREPHRRRSQHPPGSFRVRGQGAVNVLRTGVDISLRNPADTSPAFPLTFRVRMTAHPTPSTVLAAGLLAESHVRGTHDRGEGSRSPAAACGERRPCPVDGERSVQAVDDEKRTYRAFRSPTSRRISAVGRTPRH